MTPESVPQDCADQDWTFEDSSTEDWSMLDLSTKPLTPSDSAGSECAILDCEVMDHRILDRRLICLEPGTLNATSFSHGDLDIVTSLPTSQGPVDALLGWMDPTTGCIENDMSPSLSYVSQSTRSQNTLPDPEASWTPLVPHMTSIPMVRTVSGLSLDVPMLAVGCQPSLATSRRMHEQEYPSDRSYPIRTVPSGDGFEQTLYTGRDLRDCGRRHPHLLPLPEDIGTSQAFAHQEYIPQGQYHGRMFVGSTSFKDGIRQDAARTQSISVVDPIAEDFSNLIDFPTDETLDERNATAPGPSYHVAYTPAWPCPSTREEPTSVLVDFKPSCPVEAQPVPKATTRRSPARPAPAFELEEGRHRTDPLYSKSPGPDGLYHCPFSEENCGHGPTKLKCNYDKFVDSHLKPFRCKLANCSKQAFSSTACLLRHEREAHGMHGHGHCPHLCPVAGCERSEQGKGFPRLYNCRDHMRRAHGISSPPASPARATASLVKDSSTRSATRKRKASPTERVVSRRAKHDT